MLLYPKRSAQLLADRPNFCTPSAPRNFSQTGLIEGRARLAHRPGGKNHTDNAPNYKGPQKATSATRSGECIYTVALRDSSDANRWPYLAYADACGYSITLAHHPDPSSRPFRPLEKHSRLLTGRGSTESGTYRFVLWGGAGHGSGFLQLFVSTT
ncbi:hypothetical protein V8D89_006032 [Ganoderma adspersum]